MEKFKFTRVLLGFLAAAILLIAGCKLSADDDGGDPPVVEEKTLAKQVVDELGVSLSTSSASASSRSLSTTKIGAIKTAALAKISIDGLADSIALDRILPSMIEGVKTALAADSAFDDADKTIIFTDSAKSALASLGKTERKTKLSSGTSLQNAVGKLSAAAVKVAMEAMPATQAALAIDEIAKATVQVVSANTVYNEIVNDAIGAAVAESVKIMENSSAVSDGTDLAKLKMADAVGRMVKASIAAAAANGNMDLSAVIAKVNDKVAEVPVAKITKAKLTAASVGASVSAVAASTRTGKDQFINGVMDAALAGAGNNAEGSAMITEAIQAATKAVVSSGQTGTGANDLIMGAIGRAAAIAAQNGVSVGVADIKTAVNAGAQAGQSGSTVGTQIAGNIDTVFNEILNEAAPTITACAANPNTVTAAGTVVALTVQATAGKGSALQYEWKQLDGPVVAITNPATNAASVTISASGIYVFTVSVKNATGSKAIIGRTTVTANVSSAAAKVLVNEGIAALKVNNFDLAFTKFNAAYADDSASIDAAFWAALLNLAGISTDAQTVALARDRIGLASYPATMNELFKTTWFNKTYYDTRYGMVPADADDTYIFVRGNFTETMNYNDQYVWGYRDSDFGSSGGLFGSNPSSSYSGYGIFTPSESGNFYSDRYRYNGINYYSNNLRACPGLTSFYTTGYMMNLLNPVLLPALAAPSWGGSIYNSMNVPGNSATQTSLNTYFPLLLVNIISRNPNGLNDMIDGVLGGIFGARLTKTLALIDSLPDAAAITIPLDLIEYFSGSTEGLPADGIVIHKAELKTFAASIQIIKSFVQLLASYNFNYPLAFMQREFWTSTGSQQVLNALFAQDNPIKAGFLGNRSDATRAAAKTTMLDALADLDDAMRLVLIDLTDQTSLAFMASQMVPDPQTMTMITSMVGESRTLLGKLSSAIADGTTLYINPAALNNVGTLSALLSANGTTTQFACKPAVLYNTDILNPAKFLEIVGTETAPEGIKLYGITNSNANAMPTFVRLTKPADITTASAYYGYAVKISMARLNELIQVPSGVSIPLYASTTTGYKYSTLTWSNYNFHFDATAWNIIDWLQ